MKKGTNISHYTILEKPGEGEMGVVYKARKTRLDRDVVLNTLPKNFTESKNTVSDLSEKPKPSMTSNIIFKTTIKLVKGGSNE